MCFKWLHLDSYLLLTQRNVNQGVTSLFGPFIVTGEAISPNIIPLIQELISGMIEILAKELTYPQISLPLRCR